jgi:hypothetical protein
MDMGSSPVTGRHDGGKDPFNTGDLSWRGIRNGDLLEVEVGVGVGVGMLLIVKL